MKNILKISLLFALSLAVFTSSAKTQQTSILFVYDVSASMSEIANGKQKIEHAYDFVKRILESGIGDKYGLTLFGSEEISGDEAYFSPVPVSATSESRILEELQTLSPAGKSPIASALINGSMMFDANENNYIILISNGIENSGGGPIKVTNSLRTQGVINKLFVAGFIDEMSENRLITEIVNAGDGNYYPAWHTELFISEFRDQNILDVTASQTTGLLGYRAFISEFNGFPAYGTTVELRNQSGNVVEEKVFWRGVFEDVAPGNYTLIAINGETSREMKATVTAGAMAEISFIFNVRTGGFNFRHLIQGTNNGRAYGTITKVYHETGETVFTGTTWTGQVSNLPEGVYMIEGNAGAGPNTKEISIVQGVNPEIEFFYNVGKGRVTYKCFLDSTQNKVATGTTIRILRQPYNELALEVQTWRGTTPFLPIGEYIVEGNYKGILRREIVDVANDSTADLNFVFNIRQVRFSYQCFRNRTKAPATGVNVSIQDQLGAEIETENRWRGSFNLPEGVYTLVAQFQGNTIKRTLNLVASTSLTVEEEIYFEIQTP